VAAFFLAGGQSMQINRTAIGKLVHPVLTEARAGQGAPMASGRGAYIARARCRQLRGFVRQPARPGQPAPGAPWRAVQPAIIANDLGQHLGQDNRDMHGRPRTEARCEGHA
jgi:hypothetical protein